MCPQILIFAPFSEGFGEKFVFHCGGKKPGISEGIIVLAI